MEIAFTIIAAVFLITGFLMYKLDKEVNKKAKNKKQEEEEEYFKTMDIIYEFQNSEYYQEVMRKESERRTERARKQMRIKSIKRLSSLNNKFSAKNQIFNPHKINQW